MTVEEIKASVNMTDVLSERGITVRHGMCSCPFHGRDRHPSMQVFKDGCRCYTCGESFDVFSFIQKYDNCDFKTAFISLGGTYQHENKKARILAQGRREQAQQERNRRRMTNRQLYHELDISLMICSLCDSVYIPMSDEWCQIKNYDPVVKWYYEQCFMTPDDEREVSDLDVYRECQRFNQRFIQ